MAACCLPQFQNLHEAQVSCLEGSHNGRLMFSGGADGLVMAHDLRMKDPSAILWHHNAGVHGLAFEDPWLASCASGRASGFWESCGHMFEVAVVGHDGLWFVWSTAWHVQACRMYRHMFGMLGIHNAMWRRHCELLCAASTLMLGT